MTRTLPVLLLMAATVRAGEPAKLDPREALKPFQGLIAQWKGTGVPEGTREEKQKGLWTELVFWQWQFTDGACLVAKFDGGRYFLRGELRPVSKERFKFIVETKDQETQTFEGEFKDGKLTLERVDDKTKETQR